MNVHLPPHYDSTAEREPDEERDRNHRNITKSVKLEAPHDELEELYNSLKKHHTIRHFCKNNG